MQPKFELAAYTEAVGDTVIEADVVAESAAPEPRPVRRRRRPAPKAHPFWRFVFPSLVVAAGIAAFLLWTWGTRSVLNSSDGRVIEPVVDPDDPGYTVFIDPTPTALALTVDGDDALTGAVLLARTSLDDGGAALLFMPSLLVGEGDDAQFLSDAYSEGGARAVQGLVEQLTNVGTTEEAVVLPPQDLATWLGLVEPIPVRSADDIIDPDSVDNDDFDGDPVWLEGQVVHELDGNDASAYYNVANPNEPEVSRLDRQQALWDTWLDLISEAEDVDAAVLTFDKGLSPYLRSLGRGTYDVEVVAATDVRFDQPVPFYVVDDVNVDSTAGLTQLGKLRSFVAEAVPAPAIPSAVFRPTVKLLDGIGDPANLELARQRLLDAGAIVTVMGNASQFGRETTTVEYHVVELAGTADTIASEFGLAPDFDELPNEPFDLTITLGLDQARS